MHPRSVHNNGYPFKKLVAVLPELSQYIVNKYGKLSIDFSNALAVKSLNTALLKYYYGIEKWDVPNRYLCPPVPGRADYVHALADLLADPIYGSLPCNAKIKQQGKPIHGLDIGTGANLIYPIIASQSYSWLMSATEIDPKAFEHAKSIQTNNSVLKDVVDVRQQLNQHNIFKGVVKQDEYFTFSMCNPPFFKSKKEAIEANQRKNTNLLANRIKRNPTPNQPPHKHQTSKQQTYKKYVQPSFNFGGQPNELWCDGGELLFIRNMINESQHFKTQIGFFTTLISNKANIRPIKNELKKVSANKVKVVNMNQGNKVSRFIAWTF